MRRAEIPKVYHVRQQFERTRVADCAAAVYREMQQLFPDAKRLARKRIAVGVGSRGISSINVIVRTVLDFFKAQAALPFIVPAMGSHGGATPEGQTKVLAHYGITEESMGVPIRCEMESCVAATSANGVNVYCAVPAWEADGIFPVNRIKPHTDMKGEIESGICKMLAIGFGKLRGAEEYHGHIPGIGLEAAIVAAASELLKSGKIIGGLAIIENAYHETASLRALAPDGLIEQEKELLLQAKRLMPRLPLPEIDLLYIQRIGKNISGTGLDPNIIGRSPYGCYPGVPWQDYLPSIFRILASSLTEESEGNAVGMGMADFITERLRSRIDFESTVLNAVTGFAPRGAHMPPVLPNDRAAMETAIALCRKRANGPLVCCIRDTLTLDEVLVSEAAAGHLGRTTQAEIISGPGKLQFDADGYAVLPWTAA